MRLELKQQKLKQILCKYDDSPDNKTVVELKLPQIFKGKMYCKKCSQMYNTFRIVKGRCKSNHTIKKIGFYGICPECSKSVSYRRIHAEFTRLVEQTKSKSIL